jgi:molecular chaperone DnaK
VTRGKFEELTADLLAQTETTTQLVVRQLQENGRLPGGWADLDTVLLVGGSTRMPMVKAMLARISGKTPDDSVDPDQVVAQGAALYSVIRVIQEAEETGRTADLERLGIPATVETELGRVEVTNVCSHGLGVIALDERRQERNALLIERNTPLKSEKGPFVEKTRRFGTAEANAVELLIRVMEGDDTDPALCVQVGEGRITGIPPGLPQGAPVEVTFRYAADGRVEVHAREATHGRKLTMTLQREVGKSEAEIAAARDRLALDTVE